MVPEVLFSVVIPVYQGERFVRRSLESVAEQTFRGWELIVVDNGSTDQTVHVAQEWAEQTQSARFKLLTELQQGPGAARNAGIKEASGDWIAFLDADDVWYPTKLQAVARILKENHQWDLICHNELAVSENGRSRLLDHHQRYCADVPLFLQLYTENLFSPSAVAVKRSCLFRAGLFDANLLCYEDHDLWIRLARFIRPFFIPEVLGQYTEREGSAIRNVPTAFSCDLRVGKKHFGEFAGYVRHPYLCYTRRLFRSYGNAVRACIATGHLTDLVRLTRQALFSEGVLPAKAADISR